MSYGIVFQSIASTPAAADLEALSHMARLTFADTFRHYSEADLNSYLDSALSPSALARDLNQPRTRYTFVELDGRRVGYLKWIAESTQYLQHLASPPDNSFCLERFYFLPEFCGRGLAAVALAYVESFAKHEAKADYLHLSVWEKNYRAQRFYQKHGYRTLVSFEYPVGDSVDHEFLYGKKL